MMYIRLLFVMFVIILSSDTSAQEALDVDMVETPTVGDGDTTTTFSPETEEIVPTELIILRVVEDELQDIYKEDLFEAPDFPTLLFLPNEYATLVAAKSSFVEQPFTEDEEAQEDINLLSDEILKDVVREVKLGGILYVGPANWIVWLNDQRVTPKALPLQVIDIKVRKEFVELKWQDEGTDTIFPIRLRPNQRFNLDARMFLPG